MTRILCVTQANDIMHYKSHGVIGIGGNSTGKDFLIKLMKLLDTNNTISLFYGTYFTELTVGGINRDYLKYGGALTYFNSTPEWTIKISDI